MRTDDAGAALRIEGIDVSYGPVPALHALSIDVPTASLTALLGANGAGKSTTLKAISGLIRPARGRIVYTVDGREHDITRMPAWDIVRLGIAHVPEGRQMFAEMTVMQNLVLGAYTRSHAESRESLERVFRYFPILKKRRGQAAGTLSGGEQQMVAIGRGLMSAPRLLLLDEPSLGLAPIIVAEILAIIDRMHREEGLSVVLVEQNATAALHHAEQAYVLANGAVAISGTGAELAGNAEVQSSYLGAL
jgi:branched-chain amino acid transport system ATP-binding protein